MQEPKEVLDIKGEICPNTFVYTKIKLEEMAHEGGGILKVILDNLPAVENIPRSLRSEKIAYEVLEVKNVGNTYEILIRAPKVED